MKALLGGIGFGLVFLLGWLVLSSTGNDTKPDLHSSRTANTDDGLPQMVHPIDLTGPFSFAGKELPMDNFDVRERLDLELMRNAYFHRNTLLLLKRKGRYFPIIERILAEEGVPDDLKYLAAAESTLTEAVSPAGAKGVWQFMAPTGRAYGLEINDEVDERFHLEKATRAAAAYLKDYYEDFGDWNKVAAAYNMGGPNLKKWLDRQRAEELYDLDINQETMQYLFRIVALKAIMERPEDFGYRVPDEESYPLLDDYRTVVVDSSIANLGDFAREQATTYRMLKLYNPWLVTGTLTVSRGNSYELRIP
ncbi:lytic transglycosylase domain-containing protein [Lewinella sp. IMCC34191]|uniref:lytic transglycosylase domain-containing protein n=1 Tax=Lewinella sp. IMCC34191 TaxID=2259172 RepID=UPI000E21E7EC|nr:lytic transglycosylase domain-containing protein [Lewinella sp. IMCC34191]